MPRFPGISPALADIGGSVFSALAHKLADYRGEVYPLHVGDTWMEPPVGSRMQDLRVEDHPGMHRYAQPQGRPDLIAALVERHTRRTGVDTASDNVLVAAGATGALGAIMGAIVDPGDEVLILAPYWPLISGIVRSARGVPVDVPYLGAVDSAETAVETVRAHSSPRTVALYLSTPNNPTGQVIPRDQIEALVEWASAAGLWVLADEVYEDYVYEGEHVYARSLAPERTFSVHSFSKAFGMAGNRCGYAIGPTEAMRSVHKVSVHTFYSTPTASQLAALAVLSGEGDRWVAEAREKYLELGKMAARRLGVAPPQGSAFLFLDAAERLDERGLMGFLEECVERGLFVSPGPSFGPYPTHVRVCFTSAPPPVIERGIGVLAELLGR